MSRSRPRRRGGPGVPGLLLLTLLSACGGGSTASAPDVLLVTVDTLRADHLSSYGYPRRTSPFLDALAASGVRFERAYASSSWTAPSVVSLLAGVDPVVHGVEHGQLAKGLIVQQEVIPESLALLPERLRAAGYRTFGVTANTHLYGRFGFERGFDRYECVGFLDAEAVLAVVRSWRDEILSGGPWLLWVHLLDPHAPYQPRAPWIDEYLPGYRELWRPLRHVIIAGQYGDAGIVPGTRRYSLVNALYDSEIAYADRAIRDLADAVELSDRDLVVATSDHGEELFEHGHYGHGVALFEESVRVPLILRLPGRRHAGRVVDDPVSGIDVFPTILDVVGVASPPGLQGRSLMPLVEGGDGGVGVRTVVSSLGRFPSQAADSITLGDWKYVEPRHGTEGHLLFQLSADPLEQRNAIERRPEAAERLAAALAERLAESRARRAEPGSAELSPEEVEQLRALGYLPN